MRLPGVAGPKSNEKLLVRREGRVPVREKSFTHFCYEHHTEMLPKLQRESPETHSYACREPGCFIHYDDARGYFVETQDAATIEPEIKPGIRCPKDGHLMYLAEVHPERKSFRMWKCPECNRIQTNEEWSNKASSSG